MSAIRITCTVLIVLLFSFGCGSLTDSNLSESRASSASSSKAFLAIGEAYSGSSDAYYLLISLPGKAGSATLCWLDQSNNCDSKVQTTKVKIIGDRVILKSAAPFALKTGAKLQINAKTDTSEELSLKMQFSKATTTQTGSYNWKVVLVAGDQASQSKWISAFDNARKKLKQMLMGFGIMETNIKELSQRPQHQSAEGIPQTSTANLRSSLEELGPYGSQDACLIHMTSHGSRNTGFNMGRENLRKDDLAKMLDETCGTQPTVILVSACFSGVYVDYSGLRKPNRIILSAARADRTSFGCSPEAEYVYWDTCIIDNFAKTKTFREFYDVTKKCIERKEGGQSSSQPQAFFGDLVKDLPTPVQ